MKIAIELAGIVGGIGGKHGYGDSKRALELGYNHYKKHILDHNDCDVFCHTATVERGNDILRLWDPKGFKFIKQPRFNVPKNAIVGDDERRIQAHYHKWYGHKIASELRQEYEKQSGVKYDAVYVSRYDLAWTTDVDFSKLDLSRFWVGNWNRLFHSGKRISNNGWYTHPSRKAAKAKLIRNNNVKAYPGVSSKLIGYPHTSDGLLETWLFSNTEYMNEFCKLFDYINEYSTRRPNTWYNGKYTIHDSCGQITNHKLVPVHLEKMGILDKLSFAYYLHDDFALARRLHYGVK